MDSPWVTPNHCSSVPSNAVTEENNLECIVNSLNKLNNLLFLRLHLKQEDGRLGPEGELKIIIFHHHTGNVEIPLSLHF